MSEPLNPRTRVRRARVHGHALFLTCCLGLGLSVTPATSQEPTDSPENLQTTGSKKHRASQSRPIKMGSSGGNIKDVTPLQCCDGTLGALVEKKGTQFILSNNHVLARSNKAKKGEAIIQPGLGDQRPICEPLRPDADTVAFLSAKKRVKYGITKNNKVDAAIAEVVPGAVKANGEVIGIGVPGSAPTEAYVGMRVKKSGRTTGLTKGFVQTINARAMVEYPKKCGSEAVNTAWFDGLIFIQGNNGKPFIKGGDSGSMVYEDRKRCPAPVGLVFAGGEQLAAASPATTVQRVIGNLKPKSPMRFVGCESSSFQTANTSSTAAPVDGSNVLSSFSVQVSRPLLDERQIELATHAMRKREQDLFEIRSVHGIGIGITLDGPVEPAIHVFVSDSPDEVKKHLPDSIDGYRIEVFQTARLVAY